MVSCSGLDMNFTGSHLALSKAKASISKLLWSRHRTALTARMRRRPNRTHASMASLQEPAGASLLPTAVGAGGAVAGGQSG